MANALLRFADGRLSDTGVHTDEAGCASLGRTVAPFRHEYTMLVEHPGYKATVFKVSTGERVCAIARLEADASATDSTSQRVSEEPCPCGGNAGHEHTVSARFKIRSMAGEALSGVEVRKTGEPRTPLMFLSSDDGCVGISWIVGLHNTSVALSLEKAGYQPFSVEAPTMQDQCFSVALAPVPSRRSSRLVVRRLWSATRAPDAGRGAESERREPSRDIRVRMSWSPDRRAWMTTPFEEGRHLRRMEQIDGD